MRRVHRKPGTGTEASGSQISRAEGLHRRSTMIRISKILYPTDFSSHSNQAYFHAVALAEKHDASLAIAFVYAPGFLGTAEFHGEAADRDYWRNQLEQI